MRKILCLLLWTPAMVFADEVYLKGGAALSGRIVEETEPMVSVDIGEGVVGVPRARVERIEKKRSALDEFDERLSRLHADDTAGWRTLGRWASQQGLSAQSRRVYEHVLTIAPDDPEARQALGFVMIEGRWLTEEESYRAQGYVKYDGEWMTPAEAQMAQAAVEAEEARHQAERRAIDAELATQEAEDRAREAEDRAQEAEDRAREAESWQGGQPIYYGGWGYGMAVWPSTGPNTPLPAYRPPKPPSQIRMRDGLPG